MTKEIEISRGKIALVDDEDYERINQHKWTSWKPRNIWYAIRSVSVIKGKRSVSLMHREILGMSHCDGKITDHINRNGLDNRRSNLRVVDGATNNHNHGGYKTNTSGYVGVSRDKRRNKWRSYIKINNKFVHLGYFAKVENAIKAREQGERRYWA